ncbi:MAG: ABC transporter ATP-binding protein [Bacteroidales bacterium]
MSDIAIKFENISKQYRLGLIGTGTLSHDLNRWWAMNIRGKEDPNLKIGQVNDRAAKSTEDYVWALRNIDFEVKQGDVLGIIGKNGAGKSTLLKILSRVTSPTTGRILTRGRIASLLEVGTGFHPEMTGLENIYMNGSIMGMRKAEIKRKLDEIVDFAGVEKYIDTPVKRYSSGMTVRLGFAIAAHLEPEILVVDEVLAVGDAEFQKKALGKMQDVSCNEGRTVLFVSHNLPSIKNLCKTGILLSNGEMVFSGSAEDTVNEYLAVYQFSVSDSRFEKFNLEGKDVELCYAEMLDVNNEPTSQFDISEEIYIGLEINCIRPIPNTYGYVTIKTKQDDLLIESDTFDCLPNILNDLKPGRTRFRIKIEPYILAHGDYTFYISFSSTYSNNFTIDDPGRILAFKVIDTKTQRGYRRSAKTSYLLKWESQYVNQ